MTAVLWPRGWQLQNAVLRSRKIRRAGPRQVEDTVPLELLLLLACPSATSPSGMSQQGALPQRHTNPRAPKTTERCATLLLPQCASNADDEAQEGPRFHLRRAEREAAPHSGHDGAGGGAHSEAQGA